jgi:hypothetical protein
VFAFVKVEAVGAADANGDYDAIDTVATLHDRGTGAPQSLGAPSGLTISAVRSARAASPEPRAARWCSSASRPSLSSIASEGDLIAFLEGEAAANRCDMNADHDRADYAAGLRLSATSSRRPT